MKNTLTRKLTVAGAAAALALGAAACEIDDPENGELDPGLEEDPVLEDDGGDL